MTEILTGRQLRERAEAALDHRKPDRETLRNWIHRGADRIDKLTAEVKRLEATGQSGGSEAAMMMLEDARTAAEATLERVRKMEADAAVALEQARAEAEKESNDILGKAHADAADIIASGRATARQHMAKTEQACQSRLDKARARAEKVEQGCRDLVEQARTLERTYRTRVAEIRAEAKAMVSLMDRFDALPVTSDEDKLDADELMAEIVDLAAASEARKTDGEDERAPAEADGHDPDEAEGRAPDETDGRDLDREGDDLIDAEQPPREGDEDVAEEAG